MLKQLDGLQKHLTLLISITFLLTPACGLWAAVLFDLVSWQEVKQVLNQGLLPGLLSGMLALVVLYFWRFLRPLQSKLQSGGLHESLTGLLHQRIRRFNLAYWGLFLVYAVLSPVVYLYSLSQLGMMQPPLFIASLISLQLAVAIIIGMPAYLLATDWLGRLVSYTGLFQSQNSVHSRFLLLAGLLPILAYTLMLEYHWQTDSHASNTSILLWALLVIVTIVITLYSARNLKRSLAPVQQALNTSGAITHQSLAELRANSIDEIGYLTQTLGKVFNRLHDQETHIRAIIDNAAEGIIVTNEEGLIDTFNIAAQELFGYSSHDVRGKPLSWLILNMQEADGSPKHLNGRYKVKGIKRNGKTISISVCVSGLIHGGKPVFIYLVDDISDTEVALEKLKKAEALYRDLVETAHDLVWSMDTNGNWTYLNTASIDLYGYPPEEMVGLPISQFRHPDHALQEEAAFETIQTGKDMFQFETVHVDRHGKEVCLSFNARAQTDEQGKVIRISGTARDITVTREYQRQLSYQAEHDALTGLYNRRYFQQEMDRLIARIARSAASAGLLYIDLDQFKYINDTLGHAAGDRLLIEISDMLNDHAREGDVLARFGGDEFTLLLYNIEAHNLETVAENFRKLFDDFVFFHEGNGFSISCSIGAALIDSDTTDSEGAMSHADLACNIAKTRGRNCVNIYRPEDQDEEGMAEDMGWAARVTDMIEHDRFILAYQPIVNSINRETAEYELLLRMPTDDGQIILPGGFMPAAERFGLIHSLDSWTVRTAIKRMAELHASGKMVHFSLNLSDRAHQDNNLIPEIRQHLADTGINPGYLTFEIAETAIITNLAAASEFIRQLKEIGCQCALDDFGSGYCSLGYLKELQLDKIKIDGAVISQIASSEVERTLVHSMNQLAHVMGMKTIAECVEDEATANILRDMGVDYIQGHHLGRPTQEFGDNLLPLAASHPMSSTDSEL